MRGRGTAMIEELVRDLVGRTVAARERMNEDPFGNPVLAMTLVVSKMMDDNALSLDSIGALIRAVRDDAYLARAERLARYVGGTVAGDSMAAMVHLAKRLASGFEEFAAQTGSIRFAAVFTAHPTFSMPAEVGRDLASVASGGAVPGPAGQAAICCWTVRSASAIRSCREAAAANGWT